MQTLPCPQIESISGKPRMRGCIFCMHRHPHVPQIARAFRHTSCAAQSRHLQKLCPCRVVQAASWLHTPPQLQARDLGMSPGLVHVHEPCLPCMKAAAAALIAPMRMRCNQTSPAELTPVNSTQEFTISGQRRLPARHGARKKAWRAWYSMRVNT